MRDEEGKGDEGQERKKRERGRERGRKGRRGGEEGRKEEEEGRMCNQISCSLIIYPII